jgi:hypothetical protein
MSPKQTSLAHITMSGVKRIVLQNYR